MRIILLEIEIDPGKWPTYLVSILHFDWPEGDTCLFEFGICQGKFVFEILFCHEIARRVRAWLEETG